MRATHGANEQEARMRKSTIPHNALVLVGDGTRAIFLRNNGTVMNPQLSVENVFEHDNPPTREQGTDRPTRGKTGFHSPRGNIEQSDWHQLNEERFASDIADKLYHLAHANRFSRLVIVAPPKILGALRQSMHKEVSDKISAEVPKEMAAASIPAIQRELAAWGGPADW
jgi:protein required for attachment to host cells